MNREQFEQFIRNQDLSQEEIQGAFGELYKETVQQSNPNTDRMWELVRAEMKPRKKWRPGFLFFHAFVARPVLGASLALLVLIALSTGTIASVYYWQAVKAEKAQSESQKVLPAILDPGVSKDPTSGDDNKEDSDYEEYEEYEEGEEGEEDHEDSPDEIDEEDSSNEIDEEDSPDEVDDEEDHEEEEDSPDEIDEIDEEDEVDDEEEAHKD